MKSIVYFFQVLNQRCMVRMGYASIQGKDDHNVAMYNTLEIVAEPNERAKIIDACEWLFSIAPSSKNEVIEYISRVMVIKTGGNAFLPVEKTIIIFKSWILSTDIQTIARLLTRGAYYIRDCKLSDKYALLILPLTDTSLRK